MKKIILIALYVLIMSCSKKDQDLEPELPFTTYQQMIDTWGKPDSKRCIENCSFSNATHEYYYKTYSATVTSKEGTILNVKYWKQ